MRTMLMQLMIFAIGVFTSAFGFWAYQNDHIFVGVICSVVLVLASLRLLKK